MPEETPPPELEPLSEEGSVRRVGVAGGDGITDMPGDAARQVRALDRTGAALSFAPPPTLQTRFGPIVDRTALRKQFNDSTFDNFAAFCAFRGYDPRCVPGDSRTWERDKKYRSGWDKVRDELESEVSDMGPQSLLRAVRAAKRVPAVLEGMLHVCHYAIQAHMKEIQADQEAAKIKPQPGQLAPNPRFSLDAQGLLFLSSAARQTAEALFKSLGIENAAGLNLDKWNKMVTEKYGDLEVDMSETAEGEAPIEIEVIGSADIKASLKEAMEIYLDKPTPKDQAPEPEPQAEEANG